MNATSLIGGAANHVYATAFSDLPSAGRLVAAIISDVTGTSN
jgi:hypothetical protein